MGIILCLITGISFYGGYILSKQIKNKKVISVVSVSLAFVVLLNLILLDIIPEIISYIVSDYAINKVLIAIIITILGFVLLVILDHLVPHHHHEHHEHKDNLKEHNAHIEHISKISILALILHNILECMALYLLAQESLYKGLLMTIAICLHNIPLGLEISSGLKKNNSFYLIILSLSGLTGGLLCMLIGSIPVMIEHLILCFTLGMLLYLLIFELGKEIFNNRKNIYSLYGIITGVIVNIIINSIALGL